jgi:hypothetical protein
VERAPQRELAVSARRRKLFCSSAIRTFHTRAAVRDEAFWKTTCLFNGGLMKAPRSANSTPPSISPFFLRRNAVLYRRRHPPIRSR